MGRCSGCGAAALWGPGLGCPEPKKSLWKRFGLPASAWRPPVGVEPLQGAPMRVSRAEAAEASSRAPSRAASKVGLILEVSVEYLC